MMDLQGKTVVVTGASRGLGAGIAKYCQAQGMNLAVCARHRPPIDAGERVLSMSADVTRESDMLAFADAVQKRFSVIDLWINNAGVLEPVKPLRECSSEEFARHLEINVLGVFHGSKLYANHVRRRGGEGVLVNISSGAATSAYAGWAAYCAGKAAVDRMTEVLALEEAAAGLHAYSIAPGIIDTDMQAKIRQTSATDFPMVGKFLALKQDDLFSSAEFVAARLVELAFDPAHRPASVCHRLPMEKDIG